MARQFGVDETINSTKEDPVAAVKRLTGGRGADKVISANPSNAAQAQSIFMAKPGGLVVFFGGVPATPSRRALLCSTPENPSLRRISLVFFKWPFS